MNENYKDKLGNFAIHLKAETLTTPIQKVNPVKQKIVKEPEIQLNIWIPKSLMKKLKQSAIENELSIKQLVTESIKTFIVK